MDKYDEIIGKCPHCGRNLTSDHVCPKLASMTMSTHWEGCWEEHHACAVAAIRELKARLEIDPRHSIDGIAARDETIRMLEAKVAERDRVIQLLTNKTGPNSPASKCVEAIERAERAEAKVAQKDKALTDTQRINDKLLERMQQRAERAEAELANLKAHAEAMANCRMDIYEITDVREAYRRDYPKEK